MESQGAYRSPALGLVTSGCTVESFGVFKNVPMVVPTSRDSGSVGLGWMCTLILVFKSSQMSLVCRELGLFCT